MSPRAACRLERLGFAEVYDYVGGIADWKAAGMPTEGDPPEAPRVADATRTDVPTCELGASIADAKATSFAAGWDECVVVDCDATVVGRLRGGSWEVSPETQVDEVMEPGPTTVRPDQPLAPLVERMGRRGTRLVLVTTPQGRLLGALLRTEAERLLGGEAPQRIWADCDGCPGRWTYPT